jgi:hypothetical protein
VVDINSRKHGKYVVGAGQRIVPPAFLADYQPDFTIVMNPVYLAEIKQYLNDLNICGEVISC